MRDLLLGPAPSGPRWLRAAAEHWARLPPRVRLLLISLTALALVAGVTGHSTAVRERWGGEGVLVWRATETIPAGQLAAGSVERLLAPPAVLPADAIVGPVPEIGLAAPLVAGAVLTETHVAAEGPAATLAPTERLLGVDVDPGWGIVAGARVDVWAVSASDGAAQTIASARPVLSVSDDERRPVALLSLEAADVQRATAAMGSGRLILSVAPGGSADTDDQAPQE